MKTMMKLLALVMAMMMVLSMVACTNDANTTDPSEDGTTAPSSSTDGTKPNDSKPNDDKPVDDGKKEYTVIVKDSAGNLLSGVMVQICKEGSTCFTPRKTDGNGCAVWKLDPASDYYGTVSSLEEGMPKEYFGDKFEVTLVYDVPPVAE